jgi:hypothetical protein
MLFLATAASASPQDDDDSLDTDGFREDQCLLETPTPGEDTSIEGKDYLSNYRAGDIELEEVTPYDDIRQYHQHQARLFSGARKRLASTEDLEVDGSNPSIDNNLPSNRDIARVSLESYRIIESDPVLRPGELKILKGFHSPEEKGAKDSKRPEDWERKERKTVERLHGGGGKGKIPPSEEEFRIKSTPDKKIAVAYTETADKYTNEEYLNHVSRSTSPLTHKEIAPTPETTPNLPKTYPTPTLELVIGRKEVRTKEASATAESRLTLYGTNDVEISIKSQSHISVTTKRRDESGVETSETVDVGVSNTTEKRGRPVEKSDYIIPPPALETAQKKREETVNFSGTKLVYTYDNLSEKDESHAGSLATDDSFSHHVTDTGISLTRGTTETITSPVAKAPDVLHGLQTTGFVSDTAVDVELEEFECTDAGLSPIQADESLPQEPYFEEEVHFVDANTSPIEFPESASMALSQVDTSEAATLTDQIDTKDASNSPIKPEESPPSISDKLKDEDILQSRRGSGDVKAKVKLLEQTIKSPSHVMKRKKEVLDSEDEISSMKEEDYRGSNETLAQIDDDYDKTETVSEEIDYKTKHTVSTHTKQVGRKIAELQKIFSGSSDLDDSEEEQKRSPHKTVKIKEKREVIVKEEKPKIETPPVVDGELVPNGLDTSDKSDEIEIKSVKDKRALFEELISKSQEGTPKKTVVQQERVYTEKELSECILKIEEQVIVEPKISPRRRSVTKLAEPLEEEKPSTVPVCEPPCEKVIVEHKTPSPLAQESESKISTVEPQVEHESKMAVEMAKIFKEHTGIVESISGQSLEVCEEPCVSVSVCKVKPQTQESVQLDSRIIKEALVSNVKLLTTIALPPQVLETETVKLDEVMSQVDITEELEKEILQQRMKEEMELSKRSLQLDTREKSPIISERQVQKLMSEVLEATIQIRAEVKELKPDLTPTPEGQLISIVSSTSADHIRDLEQIDEEVPKDDVTKALPIMTNSFVGENDIDYLHDEGEEYFSEDGKDESSDTRHVEVLSPIKERKVFAKVRTEFPIRDDITADEDVFTAKKRIIKEALITQKFLETSESALLEKIKSKERSELKEKLITEAIFQDGDEELTDEEYYIASKLQFMSKTSDKDDLKLEDKVPGSAELDDKEKICKKKDVQLDESSIISQDKTFEISTEIKTKDDENIEKDKYFAKKIVVKETEIITKGKTTISHIGTRIEPRVKDFGAKDKSFQKETEEDESIKVEIEKSTVRKIFDEEKDKDTTLKDKSPITEIPAEIKLEVEEIVAKEKTPVKEVEKKRTPEAEISVKEKKVSIPKDKSSTPEIPTEIKLKAEEIVVKEKTVKVVEKEKTLEAEISAKEEKVLTSKDKSPTPEIPTEIKLKTEEIVVKEKTVKEVEKEKTPEAEISDKEEKVPIPKDKSPTPEIPTEIKLKTEEIVVKEKTPEKEVRGKRHQKRKFPIRRKKRRPPKTNLPLPKFQQRIKLKAEEIVVKEETVKEVEKEKTPVAEISDKEEKVPTPKDKSPTPEIPTEIKLKAEEIVAKEKTPEKEVKEKSPEAEISDKEEKVPTPKDKSPTPEIPTEIKRKAEEIVVKEKTLKEVEKEKTPEAEISDKEEKVPTPKDKSPTPEIPTEIKLKAEEIVVKEKTVKEVEKEKTPEAEISDKEEKVPTPKDKSPTPEIPTEIKLKTEEIVVERENNKGSREGKDTGSGNFR